MIVMSWLYLHNLVCEWFVWGRLAVAAFLGDRRET